MSQAKLWELDQMGFDFADSSWIKNTWIVKATEEEMRSRFSAPFFQWEEVEILSPDEIDKICNIDRNVDELTSEGDYVVDYDDWTDF